MSVPSILYIEDNRLLLQTVKDILEMAGWHVEPCSDVGVAIGMIEHRRNFDLLLIDNELPAFNGLQLVTRARKLKHHEHTPIILISLQDLSQQARLAGANEFLRKPNNLVELLDAIRRLLAISGKQLTG